MDYNFTTQRIEMQKRRDEYGLARRALLNAEWLGDPAIIALAKHAYYMAWRNLNGWRRLKPRWSRWTTQPA